MKTINCCGGQTHRIRSRFSDYTDRRTLKPTLCVGTENTVHGNRRKTE